MGPLFKQFGDAPKDDADKICPLEKSLADEIASAPEKGECVEVEVTWTEDPEYTNVQSFCNGQTCLNKVNSFNGKQSQFIVDSAGTTPEDQLCILANEVIALRAEATDTCDWSVLSVLALRGGSTRNPG